MFRTISIGSVIVAAAVGVLAMLPDSDAKDRVTYAIGDMASAAVETVAGIVGVDGAVTAAVMLAVLFACCRVLGRFVPSLRLPLGQFVQHMSQSSEMRDDLPYQPHDGGRYDR